MSAEAGTRLTSPRDVEPEFYTPEELAVLLRIPIRTLEKWTLQRRLPVVKVGRLNRFPRVEIQKRLLNGNLLK
jgi:excisionase family DNA binding protein